MASSMEDESDNGDYPSGHFETHSELSFGNEIRPSQVDPEADYEAWQVTFARAKEWIKDWQLLLSPKKARVSAPNIRKHAYNFLGLVRARTSSYEFVQVKKVEKVEKLTSDLHLATSWLWSSCQKVIK